MYNFHVLFNENETPVNYPLDDIYYDIPAAEEFSSADVHPFPANRALYFCRSGSLKKLTGFENLHSLFAKGCGIKSIVDLKRLRIAHLCYSSIRGIQFHQTLSVLRCSCSNITVLSDCPNLVSADLSYTKIVKISNLPRLENLNLRGCSSVLSIESVRELTSLECSFVLPVQLQQSFPFLYTLILRKKAFPMILSQFIPTLQKLFLLNCGIKELCKISGRDIVVVQKGKIEKVHSLLYCTKFSTNVVIDQMYNIPRLKEASFSHDEIKNIILPGRVIVTAKKNISTSRRALRRGRRKYQDHLPQAAVKKIPRQVPSLTYLCICAMPDLKKPILREKYSVLLQSINHCDECLRYAPLHGSISYDAYSALCTQCDRANKLFLASS